MSVLAQLSLDRISSRLPEFPGDTLPAKLAAGRSEAERILRGYVPDFSFDVDEAERVARTIDAWTARNEESLAAALASTNDDLPEALWLTLGRADQVGQFIIASFTLAAAGLGPWQSGDVARAVGVGEHAESWAYIDAESRLQTFGVIVALEQEGRLEVIFRPTPENIAPTSGAGALPLAAWVAIVIVAVIAAAAVVAIVYLNRRLTLNNRLMRDLCQEAERRGDRETVRKCIEATRDLQVSVLDDMGSKIVGVALVLGGAYLALKFGPRLLGGLLGGRRERRSYAPNQPVPRLTPAQSDDRIAELQAADCEVTLAPLPSGDVAVLKRCPR